MANIRVMLADDHVVVRSGLRRLLEQSGGMEVVAEVDSGEQAYQQYSEHLPEVLVMDMSMPGMGGLEALRRIMARHHGARVVIFSMHENAAFASQALSAGARGYVAKSEAAEELVRAVREAAAGLGFISSAVAQRLRCKAYPVMTTPRANFPREFEVFRLLAEGISVEDIADLLKISQKTVANYQTVLKQKLGIMNSVELVRLAIRFGVIEG